MRSLSLLLNDSAGVYIINFNAHICVILHVGFESFLLLSYPGQGARLPGCARFAAAWRVSFAIHVFGRQRQLARLRNQAGCTVHSTRKYAFGLLGSG